MTSPGERLHRAVWQVAYNLLLLPLLLAVARVAAWRSPKLRETLAGHRGLWERLGAALAARDPARPLVWVHVASAGEYLQALPVLERLLADGAQAVVTVTSVSGHRWAAPRARGGEREQPGLLAVDYLPADTRGNVRRLLRLIRPDALVYVKYDLWPNLVWGAARAGVPQFLLSATLHERSARTRSALARSLYRSLYRPLRAIFAVTEADAERFLRAAPGHPGVAVLGSTGFDSVLDRRARIAPPALPPYAEAGEAPRVPMLVVGSSWPADEARIVPGLRAALEHAPELRLVLVPHEIDPGHLAELEHSFADFGPVRYSALSPVGRAQAASPVGRADAAPWRVLVVDAVGLLSALYARAALAYVGGAFSTGVHNVLEPAAMGVSPIFGPRYDNAPEAAALVAEGLAFSVADGEAFQRRLFALLDDPARRRELGDRARAWVEARAGAAQRAFEAIRAVLPRAAGDASAPGTPTLPETR